LAGDIAQPIEDNPWRKCSSTLPAWSTGDARVISWEDLHGAKLSAAVRQINPRLDQPK
jgi:hypothetical protein